MTVHYMRHDGRRALCGLHIHTVKQYTAFPGAVTCAGCRTAQRDRSDRRTAIDDAIRVSNRRGRRIGGREARTIRALLGVAS